MVSHEAKSPSGSWRPSVTSKSKKLRLKQSSLISGSTVQPSLHSSDSFSILMMPNQTLHIGVVK